MGKGITYSTSGRDCPCCGCQERAVGCHEKCDQYKAWERKSAAVSHYKRRGRLLVLPCKVGKHEKRLVDLEKAMDESTLYDWYVTSVKQTDTPVWTGEHIEELLNDFYVIPKEEEEVLVKEKGAIQS